MNGDDMDGTSQSASRTAPTCAQTTPLSDAQLIEMHRRMRAEQRRYLSEIWGSDFQRKQRVGVVDKPA